MNRITPIQLFVLTVCTLFSGLFAGKTGAIAEASAKMLLFIFFAAVASHGTKGQKRDFSMFLGAYSRGAKRGFAGAFLILAGVATVQTALFFADSAYTLSSFLPWEVLFLAVVGVGVILGCGGICLVGRMAEVCLFLFVPLILVRPFGAFSVGAIAGESWGFTGALSVLFDLSFAAAGYLASMTAVVGDAGVSDAFAASGKKPKDRSAFIFRIMAAGAVTAFLLYLLFSLFSFGGGDVFFTVLLWMLLFLRMGLFTAFFAECLRCIFSPKRE